MDMIRDIFLKTLQLNEKHLDQFQQVMTTKSIVKKACLIEEGTVCNFMGIVSSGSMRSYVSTSETEFTNDFYFDHDFVSAFTSFLTRQPTNCTIQALTDTTVCYITHQQYQQLVEQDPEWLKLGKHVAETFFIRKCKRETSFLKHSAAERLHHALTLYPGIEQKVSQYHIASYLGIKPESLSRLKNGATVKA